MGEEEDMKVNKREKRHQNFQTKRRRKSGRPLRVIGIEGNRETSHGAAERREKMAKKGRSLLSDDNHRTPGVFEGGGLRVDGDDVTIGGGDQIEGTFTSVAEIVRDATH